MRKAQKRLGGIVVLYTNSRGVSALRLIKPVAVRFGTSEWQPEPQFLLTAEDLTQIDASNMYISDPVVYREFALRDMLPLDHCDFVPRMSGRPK